MIRASGTRSAIPMSTQKTSADTACAIRFTLASPRAMLCATRRVTSCPDWLTPSATTPLSAQHTSTHAGDTCTFALPVMPAI